MRYHAERHVALNSLSPKVHDSAIRCSPRLPALPAVFALLRFSRRPRKPGRAFACISVWLLGACPCVWARAWAVGAPEEASRLRGRRDGGLELLPDATERHSDQLEVSRERGRAGAQRLGQRETATIGDPCTLAQVEKSENPQVQLRQDARAISGPVIITRRGPRMGFSVWTGARDRVRLPGDVPMGV